MSLILNRRYTRRKLMAAISGLLVTTPLITIFAVPAYANTERCSPWIASTFNWNQMACVAWADTGSGNGWKGPGLYAETQGAITRGFNQSHVVGCVETVNLISTYGTINTQYDNCTNDVKAKGSWLYLYYFGVGRHPGDGYSVHACVSISTTGGYYDSCTSGQHPISPVVYKS
jgi:hypothetical protein